MGIVLQSIIRILEYLDYRSSWLRRRMGGGRLRTRVSSQHSSWDDPPETLSPNLQQNPKPSTPSPAVDSD